MSSDGRAPRTLSDADETVSLDRAPSEGPLPEVGAKIDRFVVLEHLGSGGMGVVYLAYDPDLDRNVALKVLGTSNVLDPNASRRLLREAQALARLSHPNVVVVHEVGMTADGVFIAMEHIPGDTLHRWFMEGHDWREIVRVFIAAGRGLWAAHQAGVVHRDFKPANVLMGRDASRPRVVDFGLARPPAPSVESSAGSIERSADGSIAPLTQAGAIMGTPRYMSPEQHRGDPGDPASDQYAFCVALFEGLHGAPPFTGRTLHALAVAKAKDAPDSPLKAGVPARLNHIMMRGLSSAPDKRFATMQELLRALERVVAPRRRANFIAVPVAAVAAAGAWFASASPGDPCAAGVERVAAVWNDDQRAAIASAFDVGSPTLGSATWTRVETELEAYADAWAAEHRDACEATEVRHEQSPALMDRRMQCLDGGLRSLGALLRTFEAADTTAVHKADAAVDALPRLDRCHDAERLEAAFAPPDDPEVVRAVEALQVVMAEARAEAHTGHYDRARAVVERIVGEVEALGYAPLSAEHALAVGEFVSLDGDYVEGEKLLREALVRSRRLRVQRWVSEAELLLTYVLFKRERYDDALNLADLALADAEHDADPFRLARVLERRGLILTKLGRHSAAVGDLLRAVGDLKAAGADSLTLARVRASLGSSYYWSGDPARAGVEHQQALTILRERMGRHPDVAASLSNLAMFQHDGGEMAAALASTEEALSIARETLGPRHPKTATYLENKSSILGSMGEDDAALEALEEVLELRIERLGPRSSAVAQVYNNIGVTHYTSGRMQQALDNFQRSLEIREEVLGERSPDTLLSLSNVAALLAEMGRLDESAPLTERAASATVAALGDDHPDSIAARTNVVRLRLDQKRVADARAVADVVLASAQRALPEVHPLWSTVWRTLAFVSSKEGQLDEAVTAHEKELAAATAVGMAYEIDNARKSLAEAREAAAE